MNPFRSFAGTALVVTLLASPALAQPSILGLQSDARPTGGNAILIVQGTNFGLSPHVFFGSVQATNVLASSQTVVCFSPPGQGTVAVTVVDGALMSGGVSYSYDTPRITSITPSSGQISGNTVVDITGANFGTTPSVQIGGVPAPFTATPQSHTHLQVITPAGTGANKNVTVTVAGNSANSPQFFSYTAPNVTSINANNDNTTGGTLVTVGGTNLGLGSAIPSVTIGGLPALSVSSPSPTSLQVTVPPGVGALLPVTVTLTGQSGTLNNAFTYHVPTVSPFAPGTNTGPTSGGTMLTINGSNFGPPGAASVTIGGLPAPGTNTSHTQITCTVPPGQGVLPIVVTTGNQNSPAGPVFLYNAPTVTAVMPPYGPAAGGTPLMIEGTNFGTSATVLVGGVNAPVLLQSHTRILCLAPVRPGNTPLVNASVSVLVASVGTQPGVYSYLCSSDFNHDGASLVSDIFDFLSAWFNGCP